MEHINWKTTGELETALKTPSPDRQEIIEELQGRYDREAILRSSSGYRAPRFSYADRYGVAA